MFKKFLLILVPFYLFALEKVSLQLEWKHQFEFAGFYTALEKGYYREAGLDVEIREYENHIDITKDVLERKATFGCSSSQIILERLQGKEVIEIASYFKQNALVIVTKPHIKKVKDLKDKKLMVTTQELDKTSLLLMLQEANLTKENLNIVPHSFNIDDFINGKVDAMSAFLSNQLYELDRRGIKYNILNPATYGIYSYDVELFTSEIEAKENPERVKKFVDATNRGWEYAFNHKEEIVDLIYNKYSKTKTKESLLYEAEKTEELFKINIYKVGIIVPELLELNANIYTRLGIVKSTERLKGFIFEPYIDLGESINLSDEERKFIKEHPVIKFSDVVWEPFASIQDGNYSGIFKHYYNQIEKKTGLKFEFVQIGDGYNFQSVLDALKNKEIDMIDGTGYSLDRSKYALFVGPFMQVSLAIVTNSKVPFYGISNLYNKKIAIASGSTAEEYLKENHPKIELIKTNDVKEALELVASQNVDAMVDNIVVIDDLIKKEKFTNLNISGIADYDFKIYGLIRDDYKILYEILTKAIKSINSSETKVSEESLKAKLTRDEMAYLSKKHKVTMCVDPDWMPFESIKDGKHIGMAADYIKILQEKIDTPIELIPTETWSKSLELAKNRICDILALAMETKSRKEYMKFTTPYLDIPLVVATKENIDFIPDMKSLDNKILAIPKDYAFVEILKERYKNFIILETKTLTDALNLVRVGEAYGAVGALASVAYQFQTEFIGELRIAGKFDDSWKLGVAVRNDDIMLFNILQKSVNSISEDEKQQILNKWIAIKYEQNINYNLIWKIIAIATVILLIILYWNRKLTLLNKALKKAHIELQKATERANEATTAKSRFLANISHEIRTPMNAIIGMSYLVLNGNIEEKERIYVQKIQGAANNLLRIINDILDFSKIEAGKMSIEKIQFNLNSVIEDVLNILYVKMVEKKLDFIVNYEKDMPTTLIGDPFRLNQILVNLIGNSIKFTNRGSIKLNIMQIAETKFRFEVIDTGIGISKEQQSKLFVSFSQADDSITRRYGGTGLGLVITKQLVELMNGEISVESELDIGSKFTFEINLEISKTQISENIKLAELQKNYSDIHRDSKLSIVTSEEFRDLLISLKDVSYKRRPKMCEDVISKIDNLNLQPIDRESFNEMKQLIQKYKFKEVIEMIDKYLKLDKLN